MEVLSKNLSVSDFVRDVMAATALAESFVEFAGGKTRISTESGPLQKQPIPE
jgi:hypothetical protein